jgi:hypothetical protein
MIRPSRSRSTRLRSATSGIRKALVSGHSPSGSNGKMTSVSRGRKWHSLRQAAFSVNLDEDDLRPFRRPAPPEEEPSERLDRQRKHIPDAVLSPDDAARAGIGVELAPQPQDLHSPKRLTQSSVTAAYGKSRRGNAADRAATRGGPIIVKTSERRRLLKHLRRDCRSRRSRHSIA